MKYRYLRTFYDENGNYNEFWTEKIGYYKTIWTNSRKTFTKYNGENIMKTGLTIVGIGSFLGIMGLSWIKIVFGI